jgi:hypothetical protein
VRSKQALLFLKKKKQKNFWMLGLGGFGSVVQFFDFAGDGIEGVAGRFRGHDGFYEHGGYAVFNAHSLAKVFWFFFSKKELLACFEFAS